MRKLIIAAVLASGVAMAAPAAAQYQDPYRGGGYGDRDRDRDRGYGNDRDDRGYGYRQGQQLEQRLSDLRRQVERASRRGTVSRVDAFHLQRQLDQIERGYARSARDGFDRQEQFELDQRVRDLEMQIRDMNRGRGGGYSHDRRPDDDRRY